MSDAEIDPRDLPLWEVSRRSTVTVTVFVRAADDTTAQDAAETYLDGLSSTDLVTEGGDDWEHDDTTAEPATRSHGTVLDPDGNMIF